MDLTSITVQQFKDRFYRDFFYTNQNPNATLPPPSDGDVIVQDIDIENAFSDAQSSLNQALFPSDAAMTTGYLLLTAHSMVSNIRAAGNVGGGMSSGGAGAFAVNSRSVGNVSESYSIPQSYLDNPMLATYTTSSYGVRYLQMVLPYLVGNMNAAIGGALAGR